MARETTGLSGRLIVGPKDIPLDGGERGRAVERVREVQEFFRRHEEEGGEGPDLSAVRHLSDEEREDLSSAALSVPEGRPEEVVDAFLRFWREGSPDCVSRLCPDDPARIIVFAACEESLAEPDGEGYERLEEARVCGLFEVFGIR